MRRFILILVLAFVLCVSGVASAQTSWVVVPGVGWGPVTLGMTDTQALAYFGPPIKITSRTMRKIVEFQTATLTFDIREGTSKLDSIHIRRPTASRLATGIGIGSNIHDAIRNYGDPWKYPNGPVRKVLECVHVELFANTIVDFDSRLLLFIIGYLGVQFSFTHMIEGHPDILRVDTILISQASEKCREETPSR